MRWIGGESLPPSTWAALPYMWQDPPPRGLSSDPDLSPVHRFMAASLKMLSCHLAPDTKWVISMIKLSFNYSVRCQWCTPFWHYNGLWLLRKCWERQGAITLSKCSHLVTLFPVHQLIFQVAQNSRVRWGGRQGHPLRVMSATQGFSWFCPNTTNSPFFKKVHWLSKGMKF